MGQMPQARMGCGERTPGAGRRVQDGEAGCEAAVQEIYAGDQSVTNLATAEQSPEVGVTFYSFVAQALRKFGGDRRKAEDHIFNTLRDDPHLMREMIRSAIFHGINETARKAQAGDRSSIFASVQKQPPVKTAEQHRADAQATIRVITRSLLDYPLRDGTKLKDATREAIVADAKHLEAQANTMSQRAKWLQLIAQSVGDGKRCGDVVSEDRARELLEEARQ
jgi:hypothetical protein